MPVENPPQAGQLIDIFVFLKAMPKADQAIDMFTLLKT